ncbi:MAG TPA: D-glycero-beta-D-manno-heptose 1-phosphate adenylyltransferase [Puia sp.]|nr:D-glycero-beta-D-manno-heptose 1-phosphate adenylyltransferase [Puia sp.]
MKVPQIIQQKIYDLPGMRHQLRRWRLLSKTIAFTNGCFDILHQGHIASLSDAAREADILIVGLNSDASTRRLKGEQRPINNQEARATVMASLLMVDAVIIFDEDTPLDLIKTVMPDVLVKGGDYTLEQIVGAKEVMEAGGRVVINPIVPGFSTTGIIDKICRL